MAALVSGGGRVIVEIDHHSPVPPFEQLRLQVSRLISAGSLAIGARLPTVRQLAGDLGVAPNTVARAYSELERDGVVQSRGRHGTFVSMAAAVLSADERLTQLRELATQFVAEVRHLGLSRDVTIAAVGEAWPS